MSDSGRAREATAIVLIGSRTPALTCKSSPPVAGKPGVGTTPFRALDPSTGFSAVGSTRTNFTVAYPSQSNDHEPNVIVTANPMNKDIVIPAVAGQTTYVTFLA